MRIINLSPESDNEHKPFVTTYKSIGGFKAVLLTWSEEFKCYEPWQTGYGSYKKESSAILEAKDWARAEEIEYKERGY